MKKVNNNNNNKQETTHDGRNALRAGNLQILENVGRGQHQMMGDERKKFFKSILGEQKSYSKQTI